jgi:hypothetical protein
MEENMKVLTYDALQCCSKTELLQLYRATEVALAEVPEGTLDHEIGLLNRYTIRRALTRFDIVL